MSLSKSIVVFFENDKKKEDVRKKNP